MRRDGLWVAVALILVSCTGLRAKDRFSGARGEVVVTPLAHASVRVEHAGQVVYVDPWSRADLDGAPAADLVLVTDADSGAHHLDPVAIKRLRKTGTVVVIPNSGRGKVPDGLVMRNGTHRTFGGIKVEAIGAYDILPGEPFHARGVANGYVLTIGGIRILFAGVTECVPEIRALRSIDVAFVPMNLPNGRMTTDAVAGCLAGLRPRVAYPYHYDQGYAARLAGRGAPDAAAEAAASVKALAASLAGKVDVRSADWYPVK